MAKTIGIVAVWAIGCALGLQALAQSPAEDVTAATKYSATKSECERRADVMNFGSHGDRHWFVLRCMTES
jgi:hypothetical protein